MLMSTLPLRIPALFAGLRLTFWDLNESRKLFTFVVFWESIEKILILFNQKIAYIYEFFCLIAQIQVAFKRLSAEEIVLCRHDSLMKLELN